MNWMNDFCVGLELTNRKTQKLSLSWMKERKKTQTRDTINLVHQFRKNVLARQLTTTSK